MSKVKIIWQDEKPGYLETSKEEFLKMFPELKPFIECFDPLSIHIVMKNSTSITINL